MRETFQLVEAAALSEGEWQSLARLRAACPKPPRNRKAPHDGGASETGFQLSLSADQAMRRR